MMCINAKATLINHTDYNCHINAVELVYNQSYGVHITTLVINRLGGGHTDTHTDIYTEKILRNQAHTGQRPEHSWFKNLE